MLRDGKAYAYAAWAVAETEGKVPQYVKRQCQSWINIVDNKDPDAVVDERAYQKICKLMQLMVHPDLHCSIYEGLEDYAWLFITATLCTKCGTQMKDITSQHCWRLPEKTLKPLIQR